MDCTVSQVDERSSDEGMGAVLGVGGDVGRGEDQKGLAVAEVEMTAPENLSDAVEGDV